MIYNGSVRDTTNFHSSESITINSCNVQNSKARPYTLIRERGRVDYHVLYVERGECAVLYGGERSVLGEGGFVLYPPNEKQWYSFAEGVETVSFFVHFSGYGIERLLERLGLSCGVGRSGGKGEIVRCFEKMIYHNSVGAEACKAMAEGELVVLLSLLASGGGAVDASYPDAVLCALEYLNRNYHKSISVSTVASVVGLSESRISHLFKQTVGKGIHQYLTELRINSARELLLNTDLPVSEIADILNFEDALYFSRAFKAKLGVSPKKFRAGEK